MGCVATVVTPYDHIEWADEPDVRRFRDYLRDCVGPDLWRDALAAMDAFVTLRDTGPPTMDRARHVPTNLAAWFAFVCNTYLEDPNRYPIEHGARLLPQAKALGRTLSLGLAPGGQDSRLRHVFANEPEKFDTVLFECLVGSLYVRHGWRARFLPPSSSRTPDLHCETSHLELYVECKKKSKRSDYAIEERDAWIRKSESLRRSIASHALPVVLDIVFHQPVPSLPDTVLDELVWPRLRLAGYDGVIVDNEVLTASVRRIDLAPVQEILRDNYLRIDGGKFMKLVYGFHEAWRGITSMYVGRPVAGSPRMIDEIAWAAAVVWSCDAPESISRKVRYWKRELAEACAQLPRDRPGALHWGIELMDGEQVKAQLYERTMRSVDEFVFDNEHVVILFAHLLEFDLPVDGPIEMEESALHFSLLRHARNPWRVSPATLITWMGDDA